jgi:polysaccharide export outer membrane protein
MKCNLAVVSLLFCCLYGNGSFAQELSTQRPTPGYTLLPGDTLQVSVWQEPDLQRTVLVRPDGRFSFPLSGDVEAEGRTVAEIQADLTSRLARYIPDVLLSISVTGIEGNKIFVLGQVNRPGAFVVNPRVDVTQALSMAGGMTPFASTTDILILRRSQGGQIALKFSYGDIEKGRNLEQNIVLEPGDVIIVP